MSNLSPDGRALVASARRALRPTGGDRERVSAALRARLGAAALPVLLAPKAASALPMSAKPSSFILASKLLIGAGVAGGIAYLALEAGDPGAPLRHLPREALSAPLAPLAAPPPTAPSAPPSAVVTETEPQPEKAAAPRPATRRDRLAQEVAILSRAARQLSGGNAAAALKALDEHRRQFPAGVLAEERRAARAQALCALGRFSEAESELSRLSQPRSPSAARARAVCRNAR